MSKSGAATERVGRALKAWLLKTYAADEYAIVNVPGRWGSRSRVAACRCYRCGELLTFETVTVDRIVPGCRGGRYVRNNIRPACAACNSETGGATRRQ